MNYKMTDFNAGTALTGTLAIAALALSLTATPADAGRGGVGTGGGDFGGQSQGGQDNGSTAGQDNGSTAGQDNGSTGQDNSSAGQDNGSAGQDNGSTGQDNSSTGQDNSSAGQDNGSAGQDNGSTGQDNSSTGQDNGSTGQDNGSTGQDNSSTGQDNGSTGQDNGSTGQDNGSNNGLGDGTTAGPEAQSGAQNDSHDNDSGFGPGGIATDASGNTPAGSPGRPGAGQDSDLGIDPDSGLAGGRPGTPVDNGDRDGDGNVIGGCPGGCPDDKNPQTPTVIENGGEDPKPVTTGNCSARTSLVEVKYGRQANVFLSNPKSGQFNVGPYNIRNSGFKNCWEVVAPQICAQTGSQTVTMSGGSYGGTKIYQCNGVFNPIASAPASVYQQSAPTKAPKGQIRFEGHVVPVIPHTAVTNRELGHGDLGKPL